jgi:pimeloyl-ACP methyl ester carboxylesterase
MTGPWKTDQRRGPIPAHSSDVVEIHERMLGVLPARSRYIDLKSGRRVHVIEVGEGPPVLLLHGSGTSSLSLLPALERLEGVRAIAVDRPGFGLSEPVRVARERFRDAAVEFVDKVMGELGLEISALAGNSMGGTWALWYALARPERVRRIVLLGSAPLLPGTSPPAPLRVRATPVAGVLLTRFAKPNPKRLVQLLSSVGEGGHHRPVPGSDRGARRRRQGPRRVGGEPRRASSNHLSVRVSTPRRGCTLMSCAA